MRQPFSKELTIRVSVGRRSSLILWAAHTARVLRPPWTTRSNSKLQQIREILSACFCVQSLFSHAFAFVQHALKMRPFPDMAQKGLRNLAAESRSHNQFTPVADRKSHGKFSVKTSHLYLWRQEGP